MQKKWHNLEKLQHSNSFCVIFLLVFCYFAFALPIQLWGLPSGFDMLTNIRFAVAFQEAIANGTYLPSWANDNFGFGSIGVRFYPPVSAYLLALTQLATHDWFWAFFANLYFWMFLGSVGTFLFVKEFGQPWQGLLAGMLFVIVPHHLSEIFLFFMFAQFAAWALLPFCFLYLARICKNGSWPDVVLFSVSFSFLILTHLPTTIIFCICAPFYAAILLDWSQVKQVAYKALASGFVVLLLTAFRWVILVSELPWIAHNGPEHHSSGYYDFSLWLFPNVLSERPLYLYVITSWILDASIILTLLLAVPVVVYVLRKKDAHQTALRRILAASLLTAAVALFMSSRASFFVWDNVELLRKIQFPFRWISVFSFFCVIGFSLAVPEIAKVFGKRSRLIFYPALAVIVGILLFDVTQIVIPSAPIPSAKFSKIEKKIYTEEIWKGWWPTWAGEAAFNNPDSLSAGNRPIELLASRQGSHEFIVQEGAPVSASAGVFYYPYWKATVNGKPVELGSDSNGVITVPLGAEVSTVRLEFQEPEIVGVANLTSGIAVILLLFGSVFVIFRRRLAAVALPQFDDPLVEATKSC